MTELAYKTDGVLLVVGALLESLLVKQSRYQGGLEAVAQEHVLPLFQSPFPFLRAKACWLAGVFAREVPFTRADGSKAKGDGLLFDQMFDECLRCMKDGCASASVNAFAASRPGAPPASVHACAA